MPGVRVSVEIPAPPEEVWADVADVASHVEWMVDAREITFVSEQRTGVGTTFECLTAVGPLRTLDRMEITAWEPPRRMGVRHAGVVTGEGAFTLEPAPGGATRFTWEEELAFPWWAAGRLGAAASRPVLRRIWQRNLRALADRFAGTAPPGRRAGR